MNPDIPFPAISKPDSSLERSAMISGVTDRAAHNRAGIEKTLERLAAVLES